MNGVKTIPSATRSRLHRGKGHAVVLIIESTVSEKQILNIKHGKKKTAVQILRVAKRGKK